MNTPTKRIIILASVILGAAACFDPDSTPLDTGLLSDTSQTDSKITDSKTADAKQADAKQADGAKNTFTLQGKVDFSVLVAPTCDSKKPQTDCVGKMYWGVYDKPVTTLPAGTPLYAGILDNAKKGATFSGANIPVAPKLYISAFLDDNNNALALPLPDRGDPTFTSLQPLVVKAGQVFKYDIVFQLRLP